MYVYGKPIAQNSPHLSIDCRQLFQLDPSGNRTIHQVCMADLDEPIHDFTVRRPRAFRLGGRMFKHPRYINPSDQCVQTQFSVAFFAVGGTILLFFVLVFCLALHFPALVR